MTALLEDLATELTAKAHVATSGANNEQSLRHELEVALKASCDALEIPWTPFTLDLTVKGQGTGVRFVDVAHGAVLIEYEPPRSFSGMDGSVLKHAKAQVEEYAIRMHEEEGRALEEYVLITWDGAHIAFGRYIGASPAWDTLTPFSATSAQRLLVALQENGRPLVHPRLLANLTGPNSALGAQLQPALFNALARLNGVSGSQTTKTQLLFTEWKRLFGQVVGVQSEQFQRLLENQAEAHMCPYDKHIPAYLFALNTYIALMAKLIAALALPSASRDVTDTNVSLKNRLSALEDGTLFKAEGISNMLVGDFFSWYIDDPAWDEIAVPLTSLISQLSTINFDVTRKAPTTTRDLFKGLYETFVPRELRHALGEVYTPDWLAEHSLDLIEWLPSNDLLDPTCGTGTFVLEALKRRLTAIEGEKPSAEDLLRGLHGIDLNPLAVLAARASVVVYLSPYLNPSSPIRIPIYLADAINSSVPNGDIFEYSLQTELGVHKFKVPASIVERPDFHEIFTRLRDLVNAGLPCKSIFDAITAEFALDEDERAAPEPLLETIETLVSLHQRGWDGIWCPILADRFAAGAIKAVSHICGNPPWVKWSHLPSEYAQFIKPRCIRLGVFSQDSWVGGIESDISTVVTFEVIDKWLLDDGILSFFITGTVFATESSQGFRQFDRVNSSVVLVEDYKNLSPFDGVSNHPTLLILRKDLKDKEDQQVWPITYRVFDKAIDPVTKKPLRGFSSASDFRSRVTHCDLLAEPVPGTVAGPWLKGTKDEHEEWKLIFDAQSENHYQARKGVTTDANGIFFVRVHSKAPGKLIKISNDPALGRKPNIPSITTSVESEHLFPLLRGRGLKAFSIEPDPNYSILIPQRGMQGDPNLPITHPQTYAFLNQFKSILEQRSSFRRFQPKQAWWSLWSTGAYTFDPYKVFWQEMRGRVFAAAYIGPCVHPALGEKIAIPDHKLYFVGFETEEEAAFLTGLLNAPKVARAIGAYSAQLSQGVNIVEYLNFPKFNQENKVHLEVVELSKDLTHKKRHWNEESQKALDLLVSKVLHEVL